MKKLILIIITILPLFAFSQKQDTIMFDGVKKIIVKNNLSASENYKLSGKAMLDQDYFIGAKDPEFYQLSTEPIKIVGEGAYSSLYIYAVSRDGTITVTGSTKKRTTVKLIEGVDTESVAEIVPYKKSKILSRNTYEKLITYAKSLGGKIIYSE